MYAVRCVYENGGYLMDEIFATEKEAKRRAEDAARNWPDEKYQIMKLEPLETLSVHVSEPKYTYNWKLGE